MIAVDTKILVYAFNPDDPMHAKAFRAIRGLAEGERPWALFWQSLYEFVRVVTHPKVLSRPATEQQAVEAVEDLLDCPSVTALGAGSGHRSHFRRAVLSGRARGNTAHDAHIAALALEHGIHQLWTADRDFSAWPQLDVINPLKAR